MVVVKIYILTFTFMNLTGAFTQSITFAHILTFSVNWTQILGNVNTLIYFMSYRKASGNYKINMNMKKKV